MKPITSRTELRWALEDAGERGKLLLEYLTKVFERCDELAVAAKINAEELKKVSMFCGDMCEKTHDEDWNEVRYRTQECSSSLEYVAEEYYKC